jgi:hypothetical protein
MELMVKNEEKLRQLESLSKATQTCDIYLVKRQGCMPTPICMYET